jgi:hypothetical protein
MAARLARAARNASSTGAVGPLDVDPGAGTIKIRTGSQPAMFAFASPAG